MLAAHWRPLLAGATDLICPPHCSLCGELLELVSSALMICPGCRDDLLRDYETACDRCALPTSEFQTGIRCARCQHTRFAFRRAMALGIYEDRLRDAVIGGKRRDILALALGQLLVQERGADLREASYDYVVPVPMHWRRRLARGVNGVELLSSSLRRGLAVPILAALFCARATAKQGLLSRSARQANVRGAFRLRGTARLKVRRKKILLVDDVMTTGATAHEASRVLKRAGAATVHVAVIARGLGNV